LFPSHQLIEVGLCKKIRTQFGHAWAPLNFHTEHKNYQQHVKKGTIFVKINRFHANMADFCKSFCKNMCKKVKKYQRHAEVGYKFLIFQIYFVFAKMLIYFAKTFTKIEIYG
jgi:hypothetical protein